VIIRRGRPVFRPPFFSPDLLFGPPPDARAALRLYRTEDAEGLARVFHEAVQTGAARAYSQAQRDAWSPRPKTAEALHKRLAPQTVWVAEDMKDCAAS
jgi:hypothetical protein